MISEFDNRARNWDSNPMHFERSQAIANSLLEMIPVSQSMKALEYGAGTGILSFLLSRRFSEITLMDSSEEMVNVMLDKVEASGLKNLKPLFCDLVQDDYVLSKFDCVFSQMVLHHIANIDNTLYKWKNMLMPGGYLAISDLLPEDGSFHNPETKVHFGFDPHEIADKLKSLGFSEIDYRTCYVIKQPNGREYPLFLLVAKM